MTGHTVLLLLTLFGNCLSQDHSEEITVLDYFTGFLSSISLKGMKEFKCPSTEDCGYVTLTKNQYDAIDSNNNEVFDRNEVSKSYEDGITLLFDMFDAKKDGKISTSLETIIFNIKVDFFEPLISYIFSYLKENYIIKPSFIFNPDHPIRKNTNLSFTSFLEGYPETFRPVKDIIPILDQNNDGNFNKKEITDAAKTILKVFDDNSDGIVTLDEVAKYAKKTGLFTATKLDSFKNELKMVVQQVD